jgi:glutathione synthase/RimK-type ligase-like ATP-grasp enzyme
MPDESHNTSQQNAERELVRVIRDVCTDLGLLVTPLGEGWILRISRSDGSPVGHIHGYSFDLNPAATHAIACDKAATCEVLRATGVPTIEHRLILHPDMARYVPHRGTWESLLAAWREWNCDAVVKDNAGTGGRGVSRCRTLVQLEQAVYRIFTQTQSIAISPFIDIEQELRFVMLDGKCEAMYEKVRAGVMGDGSATLLELMGRHGSIRGAALGAFLENLDEADRAQLARVPAQGEQCLLNWRHNLGQGATARFVSHAEPGVAEALAVAKRAASALHLRFGSVDVVRARGAGPRVLEANSGVMMEFLARSLPTGKQLARTVYRNAIAAMSAKIR